MSTIFEFLDAVSKNNSLLKTFREETQAKARDLDPIVEDDLDAFQDIEQEETEVVGDTPPGYPSKPIRRPSQTLLSMLHEADPRLKCEGRSDLACLLIYVSNNVKRFDFGADLKTLEQWLTKLSTLVNHLHPSSSSLRNYFVELTSVFKAYWVQRGENNKTDVQNN